MNEPRVRLLPLIVAVAYLLFVATAVVVGVWAIFVWVLTA